MEPGSNRLVRGVDLILVAARRVAEVSMAIMAIVMAIDVAGRYVFHRPLNGSDELIGSLLLLVLFAGIPLATRNGEHITVDLINPILSRRALLWQQTVGNIIASGISVLLMIAAWTKASELLRYGDVSLVMGIPLAPLYFFASVMLGVNVLVIVALTVMALRSPKDA